MRVRLLPYLLVAPSVLFLAVIFFVPLVQTVALAFTGGGGFGFANFARMAGDSISATPSSTRSRWWSWWCRCSSCWRWRWR